MRLSNAEFSGMKKNLICTSSSLSNSSCFPCNYRDSFLLEIWKLSPIKLTFSLFFFFFFFLIISNLHPSKILYKSPACKYDLRKKKEKKEKQRNLRRNHEHGINRGETRFLRFRENLSRALSLVKLRVWTDTTTEPCMFLPVPRVASLRRVCLGYFYSKRGRDSRVY